MQMGTRFHYWPVLFSIESGKGTFAHLIPIYKGSFNMSSQGRTSQYSILVFKICLFFFFYFTILYWFCYTSRWIHHGCTCVPHPEPPSHLPPRTIPLGHPSAPASSTLLSCIKPGLAICFTYDIIHVSMPFSQIIPPSPSPTESKRLFYTSVSLLHTGLSLPSF